MEEKEEFEKWLELAERDLEAAKYNFEGEKFFVAVFLCQQSIEKGLKALWLNKGNDLIKIHDLVVLAKNVNIPEEYFSSLDEISKAYISFRYSLMLGEEGSFDKEEIESFIKINGEVLEWIRKKV